MAPPATREEDGIPTTERVQEIFSELAPDYDRFNSLSSLGRDRWWRQRAVQLAELDETSVVLDLAAGTAELTLALARLGRPARILTTDFNPDMLEVGKAKVAEYQGSTRIEFEVVDAQDLPFDGTSFDVVTIAFGVRNLTDRMANFREVYRVLKPGGRYVILEFSRPPFPPFRALYHFYLRHVLASIGGLLTGGRGSFGYLRASILAFPAQPALAGELSRAGFRQVAWHNLTFGIVAVHVATK